MLLEKLFEAAPQRPLDAGQDLGLHRQPADCPTLVIHAGQDMVTGPRTTLPLEHGIPGAEGVMMEDVAHVVAGKEQKIRFCEVLFDFLHRH